MKFLRIYKKRPYRQLTSLPIGRYLYQIFCFYLLLIQRIIHFSEQKISQQQKCCLFLPPDLQKNISKSFELSGFHEPPIRIKGQKAMPKTSEQCVFLYALSKVLLFSSKGNYALYISWTIASFSLFFVNYTLCMEV